MRSSLIRHHLAGIVLIAGVVGTSASCSAAPDEVIDGACANVATQVAGVRPPQVGVDTNGGVADKVEAQRVVAADALRTMQGVPEQDRAPYAAFLRSWGGVVAGLENERDVIRGKGLSSGPQSDLANALGITAAIEDTEKATRVAADDARAARLTSCAQPILWQPRPA